MEAKLKIAPKNCAQHMEYMELVIFHHFDLLLIIFQHLADETHQRLYLGELSLVFFFH